MGRKSSSRNNDGGGGGGGGGAAGAATVMGLRMIQCGRQTVSVIQPDGQVRQFVVPVKVSDLLQLYPHNFVSHAGAGAGAITASAGGGGNALLDGGGVAAGGVKRTSGILPYDAYLETGSIYVLLPLPRLFPSSPPATPHFCSCFFASAGRAEEGLGIGGAIKAELKRHLPSVVGGGGGGGGGASSSSRISPEDNGGLSGAYSTSSSSSSSTPLPHRLWEPPLEIISEDKVLVINPIPSPTPSSSSSSSTTYDETAAEKKENQNRGKKLVVAALNNLKLRLEEKKTSTHQPVSEKPKTQELVSSKTEEGRS